jgi:hypothetical protein
MKVPLAAALLGCIAALPLSLRSEEPTTTSPSPALPDFKGRVVAFVCDKSTGVESKSETVTLVDPKVVLVGDRYFAFGRTWVPTVVADNEDEDQKSWIEVYRDVETGVAWSNVISYRSFTREGMTRYYEARRKQSEDD